MWPDIDNVTHSPSAGKDRVLQPSISWLIVLCETKRNEMQSVLCKMKICSLRNENLYFHEELLFSYNHDRDTHFSILLRHRTASSWCLENADLKTWDRGQKTQFFRACLPWIASAKLALSIVLSPPLEKAQWTDFGGPTLLCFATRWLHKFDISTPTTLRE